MTCSEIDLVVKTTAVNQILKGLAGGKIFHKSIMKILLLKKYANNVAYIMCSTYLDVDPVSCMPLSRSELAVRPCLTI